MDPAAQEAATLDLVVGTDDLWLKKTPAALSEGNGRKDTTPSCDKRSTLLHDTRLSTTWGQRFVAAPGWGGTVSGSRFGFAWPKWNIAIKSYVLSFYGLPGDDLVFSHNARALDDNSGITRR